MDILGIEVVSAKVSGVTTGVPFLLVKMDTSGGFSPTREEWKSLIQEIYDRCPGASTACACWQNNDPPTEWDLSLIASGNNWYPNQSDTSGFKLYINHSGTTTQKKRGVTTVELYYKGSKISRASHFTGTSLGYYEVCYAIAFADKTGKPLTLQTGATEYSYFYSTNPGVAVFDGIFAVSTIYPDGTIYEPSGNYLPVLVSSGLEFDPNDINSRTPVGKHDPYAPGGESEPGGGTGNFDGSSDPISIPGLPSLSAVDTGFITLFNPSITQLQNLANYMWSGAFDLNTFRKLFADPMDCILGLSIVPVAVPNGGTKAVTVGNISTGVSMTVAGSQYVALDCGTLNVNEFWGSYLDYDPYTKAEIYLPYIGARPIAVDDIMGKAVHVVYHVDILSGACNAFVQCDDSVLYTFIGQCSSSIPVSGNDWTNVINGVLSAGVAVGSMVATGGATAPLAVPQLASTAINSMKPSVEKSGAMSGTGGMLAVQTPYLILTRPKQCLPARQNEFSGYPSLVTMQMENCTGYTEVEQVHLDGIGCTEAEMKEIENLLRSGVIF